jgi:hypothetical protein
MRGLIGCLRLCASTTLSQTPGLKRLLFFGKPEKKIIHRAIVAPPSRQVSGVRACFDLAQIRSRRSDLAR